MDVIPTATRTSSAQHTLMIHATFCMPNFKMNFQSVL